MAAPTTIEKTKKKKKDIGIQGEKNWCQIEVYKKNLRLLADINMEMELYERSMAWELKKLLWEPHCNLARMIIYKENLHPIAYYQENQQNTDTDSEAEFWF
ncbi:hypothetical protein P8452_75295 [Trifolium repens]|nr:hypothetical protein P8452_75295 [Trifolium repens]